MSSASTARFQILFGILDNCTNYRYFVVTHQVLSSNTARTFLPYSAVLESGRLNEMLSGIPIEMPIEEVLNTILNDLEDYTVDDEQDDDITLVAVRVA
ncbi:hypothetical protein CMK10_16575 [Candidatus Poribacteria bacterium]|jgi:hypothetical protein|uniref:PPM-type phosphatase domain-containing protein n=1 Tax=marine metagenome TaxID=408172 RepID=A0A382UR90_9ZZZZ|nr:hypothetical protein [Candidatus Poribacteria bacterium]